MWIPGHGQTPPGTIFTATPPLLMNMPRVHARAAVPVPYSNLTVGRRASPSPHSHMHIAPRHLTTQVFDPPNFATVAPMHAKARPRHDTHDSTCLACAGGRWRKCGLSAVLNVDKAVNLTGERMSGGRAAVVDLRA